MNKIEGAPPLPGWYDRQEIAAEAGRAHAMRRETEHVIRNADGTLAHHVTYRREPVDSPPLETEIETGLAYAMRRLVEHLIEERDRPVARRPETRRVA